VRPARQPHVLRDYAVLADGERGVVMGPRGDLAWMCFPRWDSEGVFSSLIGGAGSYTVTPEEPFVWGGYYEPGSLIWRSHWVTAGGSVIECREALAFPGERERAVVLRRVIAHSGEARVRVALDLRAGFGREPMADLERRGPGSWAGRSGGVRWRWWGATGARVSGSGQGPWLQRVLSVPEGQQHDLVLVLEREEGDAISADRAWSSTEAAWRQRVPEFERTIAPRDARQAYALLLGLTGPRGGTVAAATTSLPERARRGRNFDYRFVWIRDLAYTAQAAAAADGKDLLDRSIRFITERQLADRDHLRPAYTVEGEPIPDERSLDLPGYPGGADVVGNRVVGQFQLDVFGEVLLALAAAAGRDRLEAAGWDAAQAAAKAVERRWREPDAGIWELEPREWTHSRLACVAGLRAMAALPPARRLAPRWMSLADRILADIACRAVHPSGRWQRAVDDPRPDASLLLGAIREAVPEGDPRSRATLRAVTDELSVDGYVYRYRTDQPLGEAEGAFLLCGFWLAMAWGREGDQQAALRWFERSRASCGTPGLFTEEYDVMQRQLRGNLPQAFCHAALLECAATLEGGAVPALGRGAARAMA
jgi:alpha,alpha-trehalase